MSLNKEAYIRYKIIDACIANKRKPFPSMQDIMDACEERIGKTFTVSTIQKDIKAMKEDEQLNFLAPIKYSKSNDGYYYSDPEYTIDNIPLSSDEKEIIAKELEFLNILGDNNLSDEFKGAQIKLLQFLSPDNNLKKEKIPLSVTQTPPKRLGLYNYNFLIDHIKKREVIEMAYFSMEVQEPIDVIVHPYQLLEFDHRWYLLGYSQEEKKLRVYGLDRVLVIFSAIQKIKFNDSKRKEVIKYNKDMYGVYPLPGEKKQYVCFYVAKNFDHIMQTNPLHSSQKIIDDSHEFITLYGINVIPTHELLQWFLAHLGKVKMASPLLAFEIARKLNEFQEDYTKGYFDK